MRRAFDTVSMRMILIILLSSVPLAVLGGILSWHNYQFAADASAARAQALVTLLRGRARDNLARASDSMRAIAAIGGLDDAAACGRTLRLVLLLQQPQYQAIRLLDDTGRIVCSAGDDAADAPFQLPLKLPPRPPAADPGAARIGHVWLDRSHGAPHLLAELVYVLPAPGSHVLQADLPLGWTAETMFGGDHDSAVLSDIVGGRRSAGAWLLGPGGLVVPACVNCGEAPPPDLGELIRRVSAERAPLLVTAGAAIASGTLADTLAGPVDVLVMTRPTDQEVRALSVFIIRVIGIVLLLGIGLLAVTVGANMLLVTPLQRLTAAVTHWRRAGGYSQHDSRLMPSELRELSRAFTEATRSLAKHERELREAETRQELLIKEIHHRVKNNLQIIASLLNLQSNRIRLPEARAEFASARDRVRALATLHRYLYSEGDLQTLNMRSFLQELCSQLFQAIGEKQGHRIQLHIEAPEIAMATDQAVPLALVVTEAVSNAVKYAFPGGRAGHVRVSLSELGAGMGRLAIEDDGVGIPAGRTETETGIRDGLGIQLIRGFSRQLGAQLEVQEGQGTRYLLTFPLHPKEADLPPEQEDAEDPEGEAETRAVPRAASEF